MKVIITGAKGQLGYWLEKVFSQEDVLAVDRDEMDEEISNLKSQISKYGSASHNSINYKKLDITQRDDVLRVVGEFKPEVIVHGAAYTNVDGAETDEAGAFLVNETGTKNIVEAAKLVGAKVIYVSTDYVFDGEKVEPYLEDDKTGPQSVYGRSKLAGEEIVKTMENFAICRTAWLYGQNGKNFVETMLRLADQGKDIKVVSDQVGSPTYTKYLAQAIKFLVDSNARGIFHTVNSGQCSWYEFACKIFELSGKQVSVSPVSSDQFPRPAKRPAHSVMSNQKLVDLGFQMPDWQEALEEYLEERV